MEAILIRGGTTDVNKWRQYCLVREIARFSERHVTRFRPITCTYFEMRYKNKQILQSIINSLMDKHTPLHISDSSLNHWCDFTLQKWWETFTYSCKQYNKQISTSNILLFNIYLQHVNYRQQTIETNIKSRQRVSQKQAQSLYFQLVLKIYGKENSTKL